MGSRRIKMDSIKVQHITDPTQARVMVEWLSKQGELGVDIETAPTCEDKKAGLDPYKSYPRLFQVATANGNVAVFDLDKIPLDDLRPLTQCRWWTFNAQFEWRHLTNAMFPVPELDDLQLLDRLVIGKPDRRRGLGDVTGIPKELQVSDWSGELSREQIEYAAIDAYATLHKAKILLPQVPGRVYELWRDAVPVLAASQLRGVTFDWDNHALLGHKWNSELVAHEALLNELMKDVLLTSPLQVAEWLTGNLSASVLAAWPLTKSGQLSTGEAVLQVHADLEIVQPLLKYRGIKKLISGYLTGYLKRKNSITGLIHPEYRIGMTATGRLSCSNPNIQQAPNDPAFRKLFTAPEGHVLVSGDFSQVELRIAAALSRDKVMLDAYANGDDLHTLTAARSAGVPIEDVTNDMRQGAKVLNFGSLYGMRSKALASTTTQTYGVPMTEAEAEIALHKFSTTYPQLSEWQQARRQQARNTGQVYSKSGLARDFNALPAGNMDAEAMNAPIQATGAEILLASLRKLKRPLASTVHDEITIIAPTDEAEAAKEELTTAMIEGFVEILPEYDQLLNGLVEVKWGQNWAEVH